jgi:uncharacterized protein
LQAPAEEAVTTPFVLTLVVTHACNLACGYCYMGEHHRTSMSEEIARRGLDLAFEHGGPIDVSFFGGEPLLERELLVAAATRARSLGERAGVDVRLQMTTNGTLLTSDVLAELEALDVQITLSFDGDRAAHESGRPRVGGRSSFEAVLRAAELLSKSRRGLDVIAVVTPENVAHLGASVRFLVDLGAQRVTLSPAFNQPFDEAAFVAWERGLAEVAALWREARAAGRGLEIPTFDRKVLAAAHGGLSDTERCSVGTRNVAIAPSGNLYACERMVGDDRDSRFVIGTVWSGVDRTRRDAQRRGPLDPECSDCPEHFRCGASCACANFAETGTTDVPGPTQCWHEQTTARLADETATSLVNAANGSFAAWAYGPELVPLIEVPRLLRKSARASQR